jgi:hypothetical protein
MSWLFPKAVPPPKPYDFSANRFPAHTTWPPNFDDLTPKERFNFEKRFRRRSKLKWARPIWNRNLLLIQYASIIGVLWYGAFYMDWTTLRGKDDSPQFIKSMRKWYFGLGESIWSQDSGRLLGKKVRQEDKVE